MSDTSATGIRMIDVGGKAVTLRTARASARLAARPETLARIRAGGLEKGDALAAARLAGIMAAKRTSELVPLCHPLPLDAVEVAIDCTAADHVEIQATVRATARTGVEMEALVAATAAALTIYDMAKSIDPGMELARVRLEAKTGGVRGDYQRSAPGGD
ncbi:MAG: cyclic pyranopterin monophosphate synthase MoaC [Planctomycetia bacterium]|nr:cyclic pyranopterin monophosphate synthase MoaC [Planctomycetia bacterium]